MLQGLGAGQILITDGALDSDLLHQNASTSTGRLRQHQAAEPAGLDKPAFSPFLYPIEEPRRALLQQLERFRAVATAAEA